MSKRPRDIRDDRLPPNIRDICATCCDHELGFEPLMLLCKQNPTLIRSTFEGSVGVYKAPWSPRGQEWYMRFYGAFLRLEGIDDDHRHAVILVRKILLVYVAYCKTVRRLVSADVHNVCHDDAGVRQNTLWDMICLDVEDKKLAALKPLFNVLRETMFEDFNAVVQGHMVCFERADAVNLRKLLIEWGIGGEIFVKMHKLACAWMDMVNWSPDTVYRYCGYGFSVLVAADGTGVSKTAVVVADVFKSQSTSYETFLDTMFELVDPDVLCRGLQHMFRKYDGRRRMWRNPPNWNTARSIKIRQRLLSVPRMVFVTELISCGAPGQLVAAGSSSDMMIQHTLFDVPFKLVNADVDPDGILGFAWGGGGGGPLETGRAPLQS